MANKSTRVPDNNTNSLLQINNLVCGYNDNEIAGPLNLTCVPGMAVSIIGANGSGKSTILKTIAGRQDPISGNVNFKGSPRVEGSLSWRESAAVLMEDEYFLPHLTVKEHIEAVAIAHKIDNPIEKVKEELNFWGLSDKLNHKPGSLSSGQKRKFLIASCLIRNPQLLVLDEPEQRLDASMKAKLIKRIRRMVEDGTSVIIATHDDAFLKQLSSHCIRLNLDGSISHIKSIDFLAIELREL